MCTLLRAPKGKFRVVGVDLFSDEKYLVGDFHLEVEAVEVANRHNNKQPKPANSVYRVYDDEGKLIQ